MMVSKGLQDVVALASGISTIIEEESKLIYRGIDIRELADQASFEEVVYLLWYGDLPRHRELETLRSEIIRAATLPEPIARALQYYPRTADPMDVVRTAVSALGTFDPNIADTSPAAQQRRAIELLARLPLIVAAFHQYRSNRKPLQPASDLSFAGNVLLLLTGERPDPATERDFDQVLVLHADHELNASTFAARTAASTRADMYAAVVAALATLKGELHGGANRAVMNMLLEIGDPSRLELEIQARLDRKERIMGFGHRVYRHGDPRVPYLRKLSERFGEKAGDERWFQMSRRLEELMMERKQIMANVDFYTASLYHAMGFPTDLYPCIFAISRSSGWTAHIMEQYADNRLIRPRAEYIGPTDRSYIPIDRR